MILVGITKLDCQIVKENSIIQTADTSKSLRHARLDETYHSAFGALTESEHVFMQNGFQFVRERLKEGSMHIVEFGFGTGLNALLVLSRAQDIKIHYETIELYPLSWNLIEQLQYPQLIGKPELETYFRQLHECEFAKLQAVTNQFSFVKHQLDFLKFQSLAETVDLVFFDAFSPQKQPELWTKEVFSRIYDSLKPEGVLVTYSSKGSVKHNLRESGFQLQRLKGPAGKRHVLRAIKAAAF